MLKEYCFYSPSECHSLAFSHQCVTCTALCSAPADCLRGTELPKLLQLLLVQLLTQCNFQAAPSTIQPSANPILLRTAPLLLEDGSSVLLYNGYVDLKNGYIHLKTSLASLPAQSFNA